MNIFLSIIATIGIVAQFFLEHIVSKKERKKLIGAIIMLITAIVLWGSFVVQQQDSKELSRNLNDIKTSNTELQGQIKLRDGDLSLIRAQNDSLRGLLTVVRNQQVEFNIMGKKSVEEATRSREAIETLRNKSVAREISAYDKSQLVSILSQSPGTIKLTCIMGDQESFQFASQLKELFSSAHWNVDGVNQALYTAPILGIIVQVKTQEYPKRIDNIVRAFDLLGLKVRGELDPKLGPDDVSLIVGGR